MLQDFGLRRLANLARQEHFIDDRVDFVEVEHQIQLANVVEVFVENFHEIVNRLQITQIVIIHVHANTEIQPRISAINNFEVAELKNEEIS